ncbi:MAG: selenium cofactor biosynthesis protein YqeC [Acidimicrobiales bacterium]
MAWPPIKLNEIVDALDRGPRSLLALVGGGGKTTLLFALGRGSPSRTVLTTTTKMGSALTSGFPPLIDPSPAVIVDALRRHRAVLVWREVAAHRARGFAPSTIDRWFSTRVADHIVVESDGARSHPFTAPAPHEPPVPAATTIVVACVGADALGRVVADRCHRPLRVAAAADCSPYERLTPERAASAITSTIGLGKNVPDAARFVVAITKVASDDTAARRLDEMLTDRGVETLLVARFAT